MYKVNIHAITRGIDTITRREGPRDGVLAATRTSSDGTYEISSPRGPNPQLEAILDGIAATVIRAKLDGGRFIAELNEIGTIVVMAKRYGAQTEANDLACVAIEQAHPVAKSMQRVLRKAGRATRGTAAEPVTAPDPAGSGLEPATIA